MIIQRKLYIFLLLILLSACSLQSKVYNDYKKSGIRLIENPIDNIEGSYKLPLSTHNNYSRPTFMLDIATDSILERAPISENEFFSLQLIGENKIRLEYMVDTIQLIDTFNYSVTKRFLKIHTKATYKGNPLLWARAKSKISMGITETKNLVILKDNSGIAFFLIFPVFASGTKKNYEYICQ